MATEYRLHGIHVRTDVINPSTARRERIDQPRVELGIIVGRQSRITPLELTRADLLKLIQQAASALERLDRSAVQ